MKRLLAIETATEACSVCLQIDGDRRLRSETGPRIHAGVLLPWIASLLAEGGIDYTALDAIAVDRGPGGFTSLRLGLSVAQGIALAHDLPVHPVSSLAALAEPVVAGCDSGRVLSLLDARMGEVYAGWFKAGPGGGLDPAAAEWLGPPGAVPARFDAPFGGVGNGFGRYRAAIESRLGDRLHVIDADAVPDARAVAALADSVCAVPGHRLEPVYLRDRVTG